MESPGGDEKGSEIRLSTGSAELGPGCSDDDTVS